MIDQTTTAPRPIAELSSALLNRKLRLRGQDYEVTGYLLGLEVETEVSKAWGGNRPVVDRVLVTVTFYVGCGRVWTMQLDADNVFEVIA